MSISLGVCKTRGLGLAWWELAFQRRDGIASDDLGIFAIVHGLAKRQHRQRERLQKNSTSIERIYAYTMMNDDTF